MKIHSGIWYEHGFLAKKQPLASAGMSAGAEKPEKSHHIIISMQVKSQANFVTL